MEVGGFRMVELCQLSGEGIVEQDIPTFQVLIDAPGDTQQIGDVLRTEVHRSATIEEQDVPMHRGKGLVRQRGTTSYLIRRQDSARDGPIPLSNISCGPIRSSGPWQGWYELLLAFARRS